MHYLTIPERFRVADPSTGEAIEPPIWVTFAAMVRAAIASQVAKGAVDALTAIDVRELIDAAKVGEVVPLSDEHHGILVESTKRVAGWPVAHILSAGEHLRAIASAPTKRPGEAAMKAESEAT